MEPNPYKPSENHDEVVQAKLRRRHRILATAVITLLVLVPPLPFIWKWINWWINYELFRGRGR